MAKCYDCHGAHNIQPKENKHSQLNKANIVKTCQKCHENANAEFANYLAHADYNSRDKYPLLFYTYWAMVLLLLGTFGFFGVHTALWLPRATQELIAHRRKMKELVGASEEIQYYRRFNTLQSVLHVLVIVSFLGLVITGMILHFSGVAFFKMLAHFFGGYKVTGFLHRVCAVITFFYFATHLTHLALMLKRKELTLKEMLWGDRSMVPTPKDLVEFFKTVKWFVGLGAKPEYGRWTYWEKFDYFAVFWGVTIIGTSGMILWFPTLFTKILPGWSINVATIIHSDEALLAAGFIFTIHFFNTHVRRFPMDPVIFTGRMTLEEFKHERPKEYQYMVDNGRLEERLVGPPSKGLVQFAYIFGLTSLCIGTILIIAIIWSAFF